MRDVELLPPDSAGNLILTLWSSLLDQIAWEPVVYLDLLLKVGVMGCIPLTFAAV